MALKSVAFLALLLGLVLCVDFLGEKPNEPVLILNDQPIIGVLTQPSGFPKSHPPDEYSYIASAYIKYLESAGARVVPIQYDLAEPEMKKLFLGINGLLLPGGNADIWVSNDNKEHLSPTSKAAQ